ncbi:MAG: hypothetical protein M3458_10370 [Acidobacteriota bacterium]|nr:hypothetical protein [Acidobacteriota bacterium]
MDIEEKKKIEDALARYISVLADSLRQTSHANDRHAYVAHLAEAAIMFALVHRGEPLSTLKEKMAAEGRSYGWGYLQGSEGEAAEGAFNEFAALVESL